MLSPCGECLLSVYLSGLPTPPHKYDFWAARAILSIFQCTSSLYRLYTQLWVVLGEARPDTMLPSILVSVGVRYGCWKSALSGMEGELEGLGSGSTCSPTRTSDSVQLFTGMMTRPLISVEAGMPCSSHEKTTMKLEVLPDCEKVLQHAEKSQQGCVENGKSQIEAHHNSQVLQARQQCSLSWTSRLPGSEGFQRHSTRSNCSNFSLSLSVPLW